MRTLPAGGQRSSGGDRRDRKFTVKFLDGTPLPDDYQKTAATLINAACRAEEIIPVDELEMACGSAPADLATLLAPYDRYRLECDGLTRVLSTVLHQRGIAHICVAGQIVDLIDTASMWPHYWFTLDDRRIVDYRARMWLRDKPHIPHGIFHPSDFPGGLCSGEPINLGVLDDEMFQILAADHTTAS